MRAQKMLELSPLVTAARAVASLDARLFEVVPVEAVADDLAAGPVGRQTPEGPGRLSMIGDGVTGSVSSTARPEPTLPHPTTMTCTTTIEHAWPCPAQLDLAISSGCDPAPVGFAVVPSGPSRRSWGVRCRSGENARQAVIGHAQRCGNGAGARATAHHSPPGAGRRRHPSRVVRLPTEKGAARAAACDRAAFGGASQQADGARRPLARTASRRRPTGPRRSSSCSSAPSASLLSACFCPSPSPSSSCCCS